MLISIIMPSRNCLTYLKYAIKTVLSQDFNNYELIISDNYSDDGTWEYLQTIQHPHARIMQPPKVCSMSGHYEWLLDQAHGEWITIVGSDDGVQPYFFHLASQLIEVAKSHNIKVINAERAYYFWQNGLWDNLQTSYIAHPSFTIRNAGSEFFSTMLTAQGYFTLPQIYAGSLVHCDVIRQVKQMQNGLFYHDINPDAYGAAALASIKADYIHSFIPLVWIGTSSQSNGSGVSKKHTQDFYRQASRDNIALHSLCGSFKHAYILGSITLWMWEAMLNAQQLQNTQTAHFYRGKFCQYIVMATILRDINLHKSNTYTNKQRKRMLFHLIRLNKLNLFVILCISRILSLYKKYFFQRSFNKVMRILKLRKHYKLQTSYNTPSELHNILDASKHVDVLTQEMLHNDLPKFFSK